MNSMNLGDSSEEEFEEEDEEEMEVNELHFSWKHVSMNNRSPVCNSTFMKLKRSLFKKREEINLLKEVLGDLSENREIIKRIVEFSQSKITKSKLMYWRFLSCSNNHGARNFKVFFFKNYQINL